ncbi:DNA-binding transcriptional regulator, LysR family [Parasporobacterium paucivorans DSM 15970]|uniref:DNA-binding transcriptional regulator, LysR family n=2 Tax=Parasporobacterium TaxID=115543 RepID=A0A1M6KKN1_9FIRM|nr:DNA-binding transcriptional regulator, LysR family [Parasporobacterium paucivorans DSM 15970]
MREINIYELQLMDIELFLRIAEYGSFTKAGQCLFMTQSLVSKRISMLELKLGLQLFVRNKRNVVLTPAGRLLQKKLQSVNEEIFLAINEAHNIQAGITGIIRLGFIEWGNLFFMPLLEEFMRENPQIHVEINRYPFFELRKNLMSLDIDMAFSISYDMDSLYKDEYEYIDLVSIPLVAIMNRKNSLADHKKVTVRDLQAQDLLMVSPKYSIGYSECISKLFAAEGISPIISHYAQSGGDHIGNLLLNEGVLIASEYFMENSWKEQLVQVPIEGTCVSVVALWKKSKVNAAMDILIDKMKVYFHAESHQCS